VTVPTRVPTPVPTGTDRSTPARDLRGSRPTAARRAVVAATGLLACLAPTVWGIAVIGMLATGTEADHRFHQVTGQGLLLCALWLAGLVPLLGAGWRGRPPSAVAVLQAGAVPVSALAVGVFAPGAGALPVACYAVVSTALLWAALPARPRLRPLAGALDPVLAPFTLLAAALLTPFVIGEVELQNTSGDEHAHMAHYFDMAWLSVALVLVALVATVLPAARRQALWTTCGLVLVGAARIAFTPNLTWSLLAIVLGVVGTAAVLAGPRAR
jgi:hypothetical protein